jgi:predicted dehydrogenase
VFDGVDNPCGDIEGPHHDAARSASVKDTSGHEAVITDFVSAVHEHRDPLVPGHDARRTTDLILAIYRSAAEGRAVEL